MWLLAAIFNRLIHLLAEESLDLRIVSSALVSFDLDIGCLACENLLIITISQCDTPLAPCTQSGTIDVQSVEGQGKTSHSSPSEHYTPTVCPSPGTGSAAPGRRSGALDLAFC